MVLMVSFSSRISPLTSTVIFLDRSPLATAVVTSAMLRTWAVRLPALECVVEVKSVQGAGDPGHDRLAAQSPFGADLARNARHLRREGVELIDHCVDRIFQLEDFAADIHRNLARQVAACDSGRDLRDVADLRGQVA